MKKERLALYVGIGFFLLGAELLYLAIRIELPASADAKSLSMLRTAFHAADEIEVSHLADPATHPEKEVYRTKVSAQKFAIVSKRTLPEAQTKQLLALFDSHHLETRAGAVCHDPGFLLRFRQNGRELLSFTLCLECTNLEIVPFPFTTVWVTLYDRKSESLVELPRLERFFSELRTD